MMLMRIITLRFSAALDGFDDSPLIDFIKDKTVVSLREHFFIRNETPYLVVLISYEPVLETPTPKPAGKSRQRDESWRALLSDADMRYLIASEAGEASVVKGTAFRLM